MNCARPSSTRISPVSSPFSSPCELPLSNSFVLTTICVAGGWGSLLLSRLSDMQTFRHAIRALTPLFAAFPYVSALTPLSTAFLPRAKSRGTLIQSLSPLSAPVPYISAASPFLQLFCFLRAAASYPSLCSVFDPRSLYFQHLTDTFLQIRGVGGH